MIQRRQRLRFTLEPRQAFRVAGDGFRQHFERYFAFLLYMLDQLAEIYPTRIVICAGHRGGQFERLLQSRSDVVVAHEDWPMETAGALRRALDLLDAETVLTLNGDSYVDTSLARFCEWRESQPFEAGLLTSTVSK